MFSSVYLPLSLAQDRTSFNIGGEIRDVKYSPDGKYLAFATTTDIRFYDAKTHEELSQFTGHTGVTTVAFRPDAKVLASGRY